MGVASFMLRVFYQLKDEQERFNSEVGQAETYKGIYNLQWDNVGLRGDNAIFILVV